MHHEILFLGLNLVGGRVHDALEWTTRLQEQATWTASVIGNHTGKSSEVPQVNAVVIFGHANPGEHHVEFFRPLHQYIGEHLDGDIPVLYLNGDGHEWLHEPSFLGHANFLRIQLTGGTVEPPLKLMVSNRKLDTDVYTSDIFRYNRG